MVLRADQLYSPGFNAACLPNSNWRKSLFGWGLPKPSTHSFATDVEEASDVCKHPDLAYQHGFSLWYEWSSNGSPVSNLHMVEDSPAFRPSGYATRAVNQWGLILNGTTSASTSASGEAPIPS
ncbi:MAG: hypothetical protein CYPHOPRED_002962 [Cyphobasidiales sp. Tagirdzhanova-0007]|nr:MAG: hypothetical protein CYPHOPRED_002962 [Cyphobasidiales sp. Tagirdzhanova-0007]